MAVSKTRSNEQDHFDLLPFIGIMMCLLGTLLLITMSMGAINLGAGAGEGWVPAPDKNAKTAILIEWDGQRASWHGDTGVVTAIDGNTDLIDGPPPEALEPLLDSLAARRKTHYALFAVRPSGFANFREFAWRFEKRGIDIGFEPIEQGKSVRLIAPKTQKSGPQKNGAPKA